jgi:ADP-L-glycero-D-manno-heptose 6-epimerase
VSLANLAGKKYTSLHTYDEPLEQFKNATHVIHIGANSSTLERNLESINRTNIIPTRNWNKFCNDNHIPFIFTSSAAVYGNGNGPLNPYAESKLASEQEINAVVLRLFNVYGPNEYHKGRMASTPFHWFHQLRSNNKLEIFEHSNEYQRDFIYVEDVAKIIHHFMDNYKPDVYDVGTGVSCSFEGIADTIIRTTMLGHKAYIPMPEDLQVQYQKNTRANVTKLINAGYNVNDMLAPWDGIPEYIEYLKHGSLY